MLHYIAYFILWVVFWHCIIESISKTQFGIDLRIKLLKAKIDKLDKDIKDKNNRIVRKLQKQKKKGD